MMTPADKTLNLSIARRIRALRETRGLSLDALATRSGVSRSMISLVERGETSATAVTLERLATGLGVALASLFDNPADTASPISRREDQPRWRDPQSGYVRRNVSPGDASPIQIVEVEFPPDARVAYETGPRDIRIHQQVWVLEGAIEVQIGDDVHRLDAGDCLAFDLDRPTAFQNRSSVLARYAVIIIRRDEAWR
jgi:transcriptional regulator with XRE-family HTH domain